MVRLLLVDDDEINNFTVDAILSRINKIESYEIKDNGWDALEFLRNCNASGGFPDIIFVDINMPEMDGFEFIERYEAMFWAANRNTKINVLSSSVSERDKQKSLSYLSVTDYTHKPLTEQKLSAIMR